MALHQNLYSPDTCTCRILETWDDALPQDQVVFSLVSIDHRGDEHASIVDESLYAVVKEENHRKNTALALALATTSALGNDYNTLTWAYTEGRTLQVGFTITLSGAEKAAIQDACDTQLGLGLVVVQ